MAMRYWSGTTGSTTPAARLAMKGDALEVTVARADGSRAPARLLKRMPDGSFKDDMLTMTPDDDARGFTLEIPRVTLHFSRTN